MVLNSVFFSSVDQRAYVMVRCPSCLRPSVRAPVRPCVNVSSPLAAGQRAYFMARCPSSIHPSTSASLFHGPFSVVHSSIDRPHFLVYTLASTNVKQSAPNLVKMYMTIRSQISTIMELIGPGLSKLSALKLENLPYLTCLYSSICKY